jgi:hypothetical protein
MENNRPGDAESWIHRGGKIIEMKQRVQNRSGSSSRGKSRWSAEVTRHSSSLELESSVFKFRDPRRLPRRSSSPAERSRKRKATPYQSAMSMLNFYINRAGRSLSQDQKSILAGSKTELRKLFGRESGE